MIHQIVFVGIDVSKHRFDVYLHPLGQHLQFGTGPDQLAALCERLSGLGAVKVGLEATGGYEQALAIELVQAGLETYVLTPARVRFYAQGQHENAKTDVLDAAMIARYLQANQARLRPFRPDPDRLRLSALAAHRRRLLAERSGLMGQLDTIAEPVVREMIAARLHTIAQDVALLDKAMATTIAQVPALARQRGRLCQVSGVGPVLATTLLADMPELGQVSAKVAAALLGVAPYARQSGRSRRPGQCRGGRKHLRDIAYMGVLSAIKSKDPVLAGFYHRLRARGKPFKLAMVATIRKLITILNAIAKTDPAFKS